MNTINTVYNNNNNTNTNNNGNGIAGSQFGGISAINGNTNTRGNLNSNISNNPRNANIFP